MRFVDRLLPNLLLKHRRRAQHLVLLFYGFLLLGKNKETGGPDDILVGEVDVSVEFYDGDNLVIVVLLLRFVDDEDLRVKNDPEGARVLLLGINMRQISLAADLSLVIHEWERPKGCGRVVALKVHI